jgi:tetratricopeptide (TPR) repeat protein
MATDKVQERFESLIDEWSAAMRGGELDHANDLSDDILDYVGENTDWENDPDLRLSLMALACEECGDWEGARGAYESKLAIAEMPFAIWSAHRELDKLNWLLGRHDESFKHSRSALAAARQDDSRVLLAMALEAAAASLMSHDKFNEARPLLDEAVLLTSQDPSWEHLYGSATTLLADWYLSNDKPVEARAALDGARPLLERHAFPSSAGVLSDLSYWHTLDARYHEACKQFGAARQTWRDAIRYARRVARLPHTADVYAKATVAKRLDQYAAFLRRSGHHFLAWWYQRRAGGIRMRLRLPNAST